MTISGLQSGCLMSWHYEKVASCRNLSHLNIYNGFGFHQMWENCYVIRDLKYLYVQHSTWKPVNLCGQIQAPKILWSQCFLNASEGPTASAARPQTGCPGSNEQNVNQWFHSVIKWLTGAYDCRHDWCVTLKTPHPPCCHNCCCCLYWEWWSQEWKLEDDPSSWCWVWPHRNTESDSFSTETQRCLLNQPSLSSWR